MGTLRENWPSPFGRYHVGLFASNVCFGPESSVIVISSLVFIQSKCKHAEVDIIPVKRLCYAAYNSFSRRHATSEIAILM